MNDSTMIIKKHGDGYVGDSRICLLMWCLISTLPLAGCDEVNQRSRDSESTTAPGGFRAPDQTRPMSGNEFEPQEEWPNPLKAVVEDMKTRHAPPDDVELRYADPEADNHYSAGGFYWRMPANDQAIDAHIDTFDLEKTTAGSHLTSKMFVRYPESWPRPDPEKVIWYAGPHNRDDQAIDAHFWEILIHDEQSDMLYFFYWVWDIGI